MGKKNDQAFVQHITARSEDFSQWYTDVVRLADLMDYTPVRGCMAIKPYGYAIWELIQKQMDAEIKRTGHENVMWKASPRKSPGSPRAARSR